MLLSVRRLAAVLLCAVSIHFPGRAADSVLVWIERAPSAEGPWIKVDLESVPKDADGNPRLPMNSPTEFYRTRVEIKEGAQIGDPIPLAEIPAPIRTRAEALLAKRIGLDVDGEGWPAGSKFAPTVKPMHVVAGDGSVKPTFFELKVVRPVTATDPEGPLATSPEDYLDIDQGYLLLSATTDDFPIAEFSTEGPTLTETLAQLAKTSAMRVVRYGPGLTVAEDADGKILASLGSTPFKIDPNFMQLDGLEWIGDDTNRVDISPEKVPALKMEPYRDYAAFKDDFATNQVYRELRAIRAARAKLEWDVINGNPPPGITIEPGETVRVFEDMPLVPVPEVSFVAENDEMVRLSVSSTGGVRITGESLGTGLLRARYGRAERILVVRVMRQIAPLGAGDVIASGTWYARSWGEQPKYHQFENSNWCPVTGCGPVAWAMLLAWFEREWNVEYAFRGEGAGDPPSDTISTSNRVKAFGAFDELHELCDVICAGGSGATWPTDMTDAIKGYTYGPRLLNQIGRKWRINSVTGAWPDAGALRSRDAIKNGYPSVVGLGYFWHYVLAYGYAYETIDMGVPGYTVTKRYLKCNMGWGPNVSPRWYNLGDTFYSADFKVWRGPNG